MGTLLTSMLSVIWPTIGEFSGTRVSITGSPPMSGLGPTQVTRPPFPARFWACWKMRLVTDSLRSEKKLSWASYLLCDTRPVQLEDEHDEEESL